MISELVSAFDGDQLVVKFINESMQYGTIVGVTKNEIYFITVRSKVNEENAPLLPSQLCLSSLQESPIQAEKIGIVGQDEEYVYHLFKANLSDTPELHLPTYTEHSEPYVGTFSIYHDFNLRNKQIDLDYKRGLIHFVKEEDNNYFGELQKPFPIGIGTPVFDRNDELIGITLTLYPTPQKREVLIASIRKIRIMVYEFSRRKFPLDPYNTCVYFNLPAIKYAFLSECGYDQRTKQLEQEALERKKQDEQNAKAYLRSQDRKAKYLYYKGLNNLVTPVLELEMCSLFDTLGKDPSGPGESKFTPYGSNKKFAIGLGAQFLPDFWCSIDVGAQYARYRIELNDTSYWTSSFDIDKIEITNHSLATYAGVRLSRRNEWPEIPARWQISGRVQMNYPLHTLKVYRQSGNEFSPAQPMTPWFSWKALIGWRGQYSEYQIGMERMINPPNYLLRLDAQDYTSGQYSYFLLENNWYRNMFVLQVSIRLFGSYSENHKNDATKRYNAMRRQ